MAKSADYEIVRYRPDMERQVLELLAHTCGPDRDLNAAYLHWKYRANPYLADDPPLIFVALHRGRAVGMRGLHGSSWRIGAGTEPVVLPCFGDSYVDPDHRSFRLFRDLTRAAFARLREKGYPYALNISARPGTFMASRLMGWKALPSYGTWRWDSSRRASLRGAFRLAKRLPLLAGAAERLRRRSGEIQLAKSADGNPFGTLDRRGASGDLAPRRTGPGRITLAGEPRPEEMAVLIDRLGPERPIRQLRDSRYFAWRTAKPLSAYRFLFWHGKGLGSELEGFLVLQTARYADFLEHRVLDLRGSAPSVKRDLLYAVRDRGGLDDLVVWSAALSQEDRALFRAAGFKPMDESNGVKGFRRALLVRSLDDGVPPESWSLDGHALLDPANWDLRMLDSDAY